MKRIDATPLARAPAGLSSTMTAASPKGGRRHLGRQAWRPKRFSNHSDVVAYSLATKDAMGLRGMKNGWGTLRLCERILEGESMTFDPRKGRGRQYAHGMRPARRSINARPMAKANS